MTQHMTGKWDLMKSNWRAKIGPKVSLSISLFDSFAGETWQTGEETVDNLSSYTCASYS